jgi:hypothetical protein
LVIDLHSFVADLVGKRSDDAVRARGSDDGMGDSESTCFETASPPGVS